MTTETTTIEMIETIMNNLQMVLCFLIGSAIGLLIMNNSLGKYLSRRRYLKEEKRKLILNPVLKTENKDFEIYQMKPYIKGDFNEKEIEEMGNNYAYLINNKIVIAEYSNKKIITPSNIFDGVTLIKK